MPTATYIPLQTITIGSSTLNVTFANIPNTYRDLVLVIAGSVSTSVGLINEFNGDTTDSNYSSVWMLGNGSTTSSSTNSASRSFSDIFDYQNTNILHIMDYSATDKHKTVLTRGNHSSNYVIARAGRWANTNAINSIKLQPGVVGYTFNSGTTISLYGIAG